MVDLRIAQSVHLLGKKGDNPVVVTEKTGSFMADSDSVKHLVRITNCLQTILDLESQLEKLEHGNSLLDEFAVLKSFLEKIDKVELSERDVERIEKATSNFLKELEGPLNRQAGRKKAGRRLQ
ncbi:hypothetical protein JCM14722_00190 [Pseudodesulfovibrio portus]|uniref:Uncharacterized protein n=2 Tax=Pseudodesulfovibrio portus TaxID=231439 RepID=A0ABM8AM77_9BACT|nr:hypothetical protein JCM14722_00190 [Pseudodesulfovibrio portus]